MDKKGSIKSMLIAIDGSEHSFAAVKLVSDLPEQSLPRGEKCLVTALGVLLLRNASDHYIHMVPLKQAQKILEGKGYHVVIDQILGYPAEVITNYADSHSVDLIVLGAKGLRATLGILLGGVAQQVVEYAACPVLVVRSPYYGIKRVLLAVDGSEFSQFATQYLANFPFPHETQIVIAHVMPPSPILKPDYLIRTWEIPEETISDYSTLKEEELQAINREEEETGEKYLQQTLQMLNAHGRYATSVLLRGDAATEIIEYANKNSIDMIIAGSRGLSEMQGWLLGSVSRKLVHYAPCSVMLVKRAPKQGAD
jgi:nucleotide-binding universal stress UspA family protein